MEHVELTRNNPPASDPVDAPEHWRRFAPDLEAGKVIGRIRPTGLRPKFIDKIEAAGIHLPPSVFGIGMSRY